VTVFGETGLDRGGFFMRCFAKDQKIISKEEMMDGSGISSNRQAFEVS
jgi:hypothetical protein